MTGTRSFTFHFLNDVCEAIGVPIEFSTCLYFDDPPSHKELVISFLRRAKAVGACVSIDEVMTLRSDDGCVSFQVYFDDVDDEEFMWGMDEETGTPGFQCMQHHLIEGGLVTCMWRTVAHNGVYRLTMDQMGGIGGI